MKIAMIDPSGFTPPYDHHLCTALAECDPNIRLYTSTTFPRLEKEREYNTIKLFYRFSEDVIRGKSTIQKGLKGVEHIVDIGRLIHQLSEWNPDVIHFQWLPLPIVDERFIPIFRRIAPLIHTVHDPTPFHGESTFTLQQWRAKAIRKKFDHLIVHTEQGRSTLLDRGVDPKQISVIPHGILRYENDSEDVDDQIKQKPASHRILFFGTIKQYKGIDTLLRAFAELPIQLRSNTELYIAGRAKMNISPLRNLANESGIEPNITWDIGYVPDHSIPSLIQSADILVLPYRDIDQSGVLMTVLPYGTPIIASDIGGFAEVLTDGEHGRLVPPDSPQQLSAALNDLLTDEDQRDKMSRQLQRLASESHSWDYIAKQTIELYQQISTSENSKSD